MKSNPNQLLSYLPFASVVLLGLTLVLYGAELVLYPGVIRAKTGFPSILVALAALIFLALTSTFTPQKKTSLIVKIQKLALYTLPITSGTFLILTYLEKIKYTNFVLSTFHIHLKSLEMLVALQAVVGFFFFLQQYLTIAVKRTKKQQVATLLLIGILSAVSLTLLQNLKVTAVMAFTDYSYILQNPLASYDQKMSKLVSIYPYYHFVNTYTPETARIALPPFREPWGFVGNEGFTRYFLYPRLTRNTSSVAEVRQGNFTHVLIARGMFPAPDGVYGWPQEVLEGRRIFLFNFETGEVTETEYTIFDGTMPENQNLWGLVEL